MMMTMMMMMTKVAELVSDENLMHVWEAASMRCLLCWAKSAQCSLCLCSQLLLLCAFSAQQSLLLWFSSQQSLSAHCASALNCWAESAPAMCLLCSVAPPNWRRRKQQWSPILSFPGTGLQNDLIFTVSNRYLPAAHLNLNLNPPEHSWNTFPTWEAWVAPCIIEEVASCTFLSQSRLMAGQFSLIIQSKQWHLALFSHNQDRWQSSFLLSFTYIWLGSTESLHKIRAFCLDL